MQGGLAPQGVRQDCHCSSMAGISEDASEAASNQTDSFKSYRWRVQPCHGFLFPTIMSRISEASCLKELRNSEHCLEEEKKNLFVRKSWQLVWIEITENFSLSNRSSDDLLLPTKV